MSSHTNYKYKEIDILPLIVVYFIHISPYTMASVMNIGRSNSQQSRDECIAFLGQGHSISELSEKCKELLGANSRVGLLARRNSAVGRTWNPGDGHNSRSYSESTFGSAHDVPGGERKSVGEIFLEGKTPEQTEKIKRSIARTASRGAKIRTEELVTPAEVQKEGKIQELQRRASREKHQQQ
jgi:hypothetical protein